MRIPLCLGALICGAVAVFTIGAAPAAAPVPARPPQNSSTLDDQIDLGLTVYNSDIALVRDVRNVQLPSGRFDLSFIDIAATVNPATVHFRSLTEPESLDVLEQNYEYDLLDPEKLLRKYVGREVTLVRMHNENGTTRQEELTAHLVSFNGSPVWRIGNEIVTGLHPSHMRFPELPANLYTHPTLIWTLQNDGAARHRVETSYLAGKLTWNADYVLTVGRDEKAADLDGWVTLTNVSGTSFRNARLQLVAGDLNRAKAAVDDLRRSDMLAARAEPRMAQESFSDYHLYTLDRRTSINNAETKQLSMLTGSGVPVHKRYVVDGQALHYRNGRRPGSPIKDVVQVFYQFRNEQKSGLGMPMPAGTLRVYQADSSGGIQFVGEDAIDHTPKDETLNVKIGHAFDVVCERKQVDFQQISRDVYEFEFELTLRNHKSAPIVVEVNEPIGGTWQMLRSSHPATKTDAWAARFSVAVQADGEAVLRYRTRVNY